jgi:two-component system, NtrC family, nitrogen regulation sensor histidine kinase NtrY
MSKKILEYFRGDRKYFAIVFFILVMIFVVGLVTPVLIDNKKDNWNDELSNKTIEIENGIKSILSEKENQLVLTKDQIKSELRKSLNVTDYEYGKLNALVNQSDYQNYSLEIVAPNGKIIAWNNSPAIEQEEIFPFVYPINETHFFNSPLITYLSIIDTVILHSDRFYILLSQPIEKHYSLQNKYYTEISLSDELSDRFNTLVNVFFDPYASPPKDGRMHSVILLNSENSKIGLASFFKPSLNVEVAKIQENAMGIQILLLVIGLIFLTLGMKSDFKSIKLRSIRLLILIIYLTVIRLVLYWSGFPARFVEGPLADPSYFSSTFAWGIVKTPIEFFITNIFLLIVGIIFFVYILEYFKEEDSEKLNVLKFIAAPVVAFLSFYTMRGFAASVKSVIFDSTIRYFKEPELIPSLPTLLMNFNILILSLGCILVIIALLLLFGKYVKLLKSQKTILHFIILFFLTQVLCYFFFLKQSEPLITIFMYFGFFTLIFILIAILIFREKPVSVNLIYTSLVASVIAISMLNHFNLELERKTLKVIAYEINRSNKELLSYLVDETLRTSVNDDKLVSSFYRLNSNYNAEAFIAWSKSSLQRESLSSELTVLDRNFNSLGKFTVGFDESVDYKSLIPSSSDGKIVSAEIPISSEEGIGFAGIVPVENEDIINGYIAVAAKFSIENLGAADYPDFLVSNKAALGSVVDLNLIKVFEFSDNRLLQARGNIFPSKELREQIFKAELSIYGDGWATLSFYGEDYITFILRTKLDGVDRTTVVAIKDKEITWSLFNFFKIFIVHSIFIFLLALTLVALRYIKSKYTFRAKLLGAFLLISIIPIIALAVYNREVVKERTSSAIANELGKRSEYLENHIRAQKQKNPQRDFKTSFVNAGKELKIAFTIYENSDEDYSSKNEYYKNGLLSDKLNSEAHYNLNYLSYRELLLRESIDKYVYDAYYKKIDFGDKSFILCVNDAFNKIELSYSPVDADVFLFGVYSFAVIIITLLSTFFANQISSPIRQLTRATNAVAQGDLSIQLDNKEKGELKELFDGFNSMTGELQKNQNEIAELERENAWKEMAKQVAHEIKNPLTPMKLSVQQLVASYSDKKTEFDEILKKLSQAILNQIENLSLIASEFSSFAKMPTLKLEEFDLIPVIKDTVHLFGDEEAEVNFNTTVEFVKVESDNSQMRRMFINLIRNSIQAKASEIKISLFKEENFVIIDAADNGTGIHFENQSKIFETNFTTKEKGLGLGLKLIKRFLENTGGEIKLLSSTGAGTVFRIKIPVKSS